LRQEEVDQQRDEDAGDDRELLQRSQPAADAGRGDLGDVGRRDDRGHADPEAADDATDDQPPQVRGQAGHDRTDQEQRGRHLHDGQPTQLIGQSPGHQRTRGGPEQGGRHRETQGGRVGLELIFDRGHGPVDHRAVVPEQESAEGGHARDAHHTLARGVVVVDRPGRAESCAVLTHSVLLHSPVKGIIRGRAEAEPIAVPGAGVVPPTADRGAQGKRNSLAFKVFARMGR
jgi:hypothetical protein